MTAPAANAGKGQAAEIDLSAGLSRRFRAQAPGDRQLRQVDDAVAAAADEVDMGLGIAIEPLHATDGAQAADQPLLLEQRQVAVHRGQRNIRIFPADLGMDPVGGGVDIRRPNAGEDRIPLAEMLAALLHRHLLFKNDHHLQDEYIIPITICQ